MKKSTSSSKHNRKTPRKSPRNGRRPWFWRFVFRAGAIGLVLLAGWTVYLDAVITSRFEGRRFEVPSNGFAGGLESRRGALAKVIDATVNIGVFGLVDIAHRIDHRAGF